MIALSHAFPPEFARFGDTLRPPQPDAVPLQGLLHGDAAAALVARFGASLCSCDRRSVLSMWSQYYFLTLLPAAVAAALVEAEVPDMAWGTAGVVLGDEGGPVAVCVPGALPRTASPCPAERLTPLLRGHLVPFVRALAEAGLHEAVAWSNAGHVALWALRTVLAPPERTERLAEALRAPDWVDGAPNPLWRTMAAGTRTVCCLRHRLPGVTRCGNCPVGCGKRG